jgi:hypothetical protein
VEQHVFSIVLKMANARKMEIGVAVFASVLIVATGWVIVDAAYQEPYASVTVRDAYAQLVISSVLVVLWLELVACAIGFSVKRWLSVLVTVCVIAGAVISVSMLFACQRSYIADVAGAMAKRCHSSP